MCVYMTIFLVPVEEDRTEILKSGLDLSMQYRSQATTEVSLLNHIRHGRINALVKYQNNSPPKCTFNYVM